MPPIQATACGIVEPIISSRSKGPSPRLAIAQEASTFQLRLERSSDRAAFQRRCQRDAHRREARVDEHGRDDRRNHGSAGAEHVRDRELSGAGEDDDRRDDRRDDAPAEGSSQHAERHREHEAGHREAETDPKASTSCPRASHEEFEQQRVDLRRRIELEPMARTLDALIAPQPRDVLAQASMPSSVR